MEDNQNNRSGNSGFGGDSGASGGMNSGGTGSSSTPGTAVGDSGDSGFAPGVVSVLERFGVTETQLNVVRDTFKNMNIEDSLEKAREQVSDSMTKARDYAKQNPGAMLAGLAVVVIGAGLLAGAMKKKD